jgi:hypothetical protein
LIWTKPVAPRALDQTTRHEAADREVRVQTMAARMPLRHPDIRECATVDPFA